MHPSLYKNILSVVGGIALLAGAFYGFDQYIEAKIKNAVSRPQIIDEISKTVRPSVFFDGNGSILKDTGGMSFIEKIDISDEEWIGTSKVKFPTKVTITPKKHLEFPPVIQPVGSFQIISKPKRSKGFIWIYQFTLTANDSEIENYIFRLEVIQ